MIPSVKNKRSYITEEKIENLRKNVSQFTWAKEKADEIVRKADALLSFGVDRFVAYYMPQEIPRGYYVNQKHGCPNCGTAMIPHLSNHWLFDFEKHPWKVICPHCGKQYPSNDFMKFYESGLDMHGVFSYERADRTLLVNELYPEEGPDYAVDDGHGWLRDPNDPVNGRFCFIPYLNFWMMWCTYGSLQNFNGAKAIENLTLAYLITKNRRYGIAGAVLYYRLAQIYPTYDLDPYVKQKCYYMDHGSAETGRIIGNISDPITLSKHVEYYDLLFDCLDDDFAAFLRENPIRYIGNAPQSGYEIRTTIENNLHHMAYPDYLNRRLESNPGYVQALLLKSAIILEREDLLDTYAEFLYSFVDRDVPLFTKFDLDSLFMEKIDRDGFAGEVAPIYNCGWFATFMDAALCLRGHKYDLFEHPKFKKLLKIPQKYLCADRYTVTLADSGTCGSPQFPDKKDALLQAFLTYKDPRTARHLLQIAGDGPICTDWFLDCSVVEDAIRMASEEEPFRSESRLFPQFGFAAIESHPEGKDPECNAVYFGKNSGHGHHDTLNLYLYGFGIDMMPDFGTPSYKDYNAARFRWESNMISHNTALIPQTEPFSDEISDLYRLGTNNCNPIEGGHIRHFLAGGAVSLIDVEAPDLYDVPYRRTVITVDTDGKSRYLIDLFEVGGSQQHLSYHAAGIKTDLDGADFIPQNGGTYAGKEIPYADETYSHDWCDGFNYLTDVRRASIDRPFSVDWTCDDTWHVWTKPRDVHLKIHMLSGVQEAALCSGMPPQNKPGNPRAYTYLIAKHSGDTARFVSVLEPYEKESFIESCRCQSADDLDTIVVRHKSGRVDTITCDRQCRNGFLTVESTISGASTFFFSYGTQCLTGTVVDFTRELANENDVVIRFDSSVQEIPVGAYMDIEANEKPNAFYEIKSARYLGDNLWKIGTGDCTFIAGYVDRMEKEKGYRYFIKKDAGVTITR